jgi:tryptophanyl-tRNA synthetase
MDAPYRPRIFTGFQPSGPLTIANYLGALKTWVELQATHESFLMVADLHAVTVPQEPDVLRGRSLEWVALLAACGIDVAKSVVFMQSHVPAHTQLLWVLNCGVPMGALQRMTQFKDKAGGHAADVRVGLFDYPVLMAADILLYGADLVPVGDDQQQHMEFTRRVARKFNAAYGDIFKIPEIYTPRAGARLMGLQNPASKMSKSDPNGDNYVALRDAPETVRRKIRTAVTDSGSEVRVRPDKPGISNLVALYAAVSGEVTGSIEARYVGKGYAEFKSHLSERIIDFLMPIQQRYRVFASDRATLAEILRQGADQARARSEETLAKVYEAVGFLPPGRGDRRLRAAHGSSRESQADHSASAVKRGPPQRRNTMDSEETRGLNPAAAAETDADAEYPTDCCGCCCCDAEEECRLEA